MSKPQVIITLIREQGVLPLYFHPDMEKCLQVLHALYAAGIRAVEFTNRGPEALENFKALRKVTDREMKDLQLGIGTVKHKKDAKNYIRAGADFIICPGMIEEVGETVLHEDMLWIPGCMTTTEIIRAEAVGAKLVKLFPGNLLGPGFMSAIKELFPGMLFMPTGGVESERSNLEAWFRSGVCAVGMGSKLVSRTVLEEGQYEALTQATRQALELVKEVRSSIQ